MKLSEFTRGRDNNFNLIRIVAALLVLFTHSFALALGDKYAEPLRRDLGVTWGSIAVDVFFVTSGFLVTASLLARRSTVEFIWARVLRIFLALLVMLLLTVFGLALFFTSLPLSSYLASYDTYYYLIKNAILFKGIVYRLPGVFDGNPFGNAVNGSLWTMPIELRMYGILAIVWVALPLAGRHRLRVFEVLVVAGAAASGIFVLQRDLYAPIESDFARLFFMFFSGGAFYVLRHRVALCRTAFLLIAIALPLAAYLDRQTFFFLYTLTVAYFLFYLAYVPAGAVRRYNRLGDYSYGVYIYAFPVQQSVAALIPGVSVLNMILISAATTLLLAALSWHLIERRALDLKSSLVRHTRRILGRDSPTAMQ